MIPDNSTRLPVNTKILTRFFERIRIDPSITYQGTPCWLWMRWKDKDGYGYFWYEGRNWRAHAFTYKAFVENFPKTLVSDHLCRVRHCVNPTHIEPVSNFVNVVERGKTVTAANARKTHCKYGHEFSESNTQIDGKGKRVCRICRRENDIRLKPRKGRVKTHCRKGHLYTQPSEGRGEHRCIICRATSRPSHKLKGAN